MDHVVFIEIIFSNTQRILLSAKTEPSLEHITALLNDLIAQLQKGEGTTYVDAKHGEGSQRVYHFTITSSDEPVLVYIDKIPLIEF
ncbi:hypothetical protein BHU72_01100 [Desulfuribacillus stibiiarsenatis]|uniref:Uncharacterized protein n=1 Tax=Desulfuribacillus stibiiarsenatis TaxID=1390249 RepID=A0A1E5L9S7_9FIRM|nr:hypothetical protein [Desulfuribacillus stibiiarsenatis]OEH86890.1 hypothetical protein BHU72_01100 [Desulfuribacillus stibiiarsenatis]